MWIMIFLSSLFSFFPALAEQQLIYSHEGGVEWVLADKAHPGELLVQEHGGGLVQIRVSSGASAPEVIARYENRCGLTSAYWSDLQWARPVLVSAKKTCVLSQGALIAGGEQPKLQNAYAVSFLSQLPDRSYFLVNSRPWKTAGLIHLKTVLNDGSVSLLEFVREVPGFSGPMALDPTGRSLIYTEATGESYNRVYHMDQERLKELWRTGKVGRFSELALSSGEFPGMSLWMAAGTAGELYGDDQGARWVRNSTVRKLKDVENCKVVGLMVFSGDGSDRDQVILLCSEKSVRLQPLAALLQD